MERRALLAIVLSLALLLVWQALFAPSSAPPPTAPEAPARAAPAPAAPTPGAGETRFPMPRPVGAIQANPVVEVSTPLYRATFGADGAVTSWELHYRGTKSLVVGGALGPLGVGLHRPDRAPEVLALVPRAERLDLRRERSEGSLAFGGTTADGLRVEKTLRFRAESYRVEIELRVESRQPAGPVTVTLYWTTPVTIPGAKPEAPWVTFGEGPDHRYLLGRILVEHDGVLAALDAPAPALKDPKAAPERAELKDPRLVEVKDLQVQRGWAALENDYFIAALIPEGGARLVRGRERDLAEVGLVFGDVRLDPDRPWIVKAAAYIGPKEWNQLRALGVGLEEAQARNYGGFPFPQPYGIPMWFFCVPLLWLMNFFGTHMPGQNYGVAIILLTVLVKIVFYPLTQKSMTSMKQMQALQPQVNALRAKHKGDPQRFQREQMELFRKYKVNPMGGCLPMVIQIPIFYALYLTLQYSVELQGAPFVLWITDLSKKDPYYVLPILMGVSMLVQQMMTPTVGDPRQARVMLIMPVVFTVMFLEFPTGLVLYWLVNNVLSIAQQYLIDRAVRRLRPAPAEEARGSKEKGKA